MVTVYKTAEVGVPLHHPGPVTVRRGGRGTKRRNPLMKPPAKTSRSRGTRIQASSPRDAIAGVIA